MQKQKASKILLSCAIACIICFASTMTAFADPIIGTVNENYKQNLEAKYGFQIIIDESVKQEGFYTDPVLVSDAELKVLKDIDSAFSMLPPGFVKEVNDYFKKQGYSPKIEIIHFDDSDVTGRFYADGEHIMRIEVFKHGIRLIDTLLHEFGHEVEYYLEYKKKNAEIEDYFALQNKYSQYQYNEDYERLSDMDLDSKYYDFYISKYSSSNFAEDFAELFSCGVMQPRYISAYGNGATKPVHQKIKKMSQVLCGQLQSLKGSAFLMNCIPDPASQWAQNTVRSAKQQGIIPWPAYGLNTSEITRYDAALILQPFLYQYISEEVLYRRAGVQKNEFDERFVYDIADAEDIYLLTSLPIMTVDSNRRFYPSQKIQRQEAAIIFSRVAEHLLISEEQRYQAYFNDYGNIADWAKVYVNDAATLGIMNGDAKNNFNPQKNITYQEFYSCLLKIVSMAEDFNENDDSSYDVEPYANNLNGTALSQEGWLLYYNRGDDQVQGFTGQGEYHWENGDWYEGDFVDGERTGQGEYTWSNDDYYRGDFVNGERTGNGKLIEANGSWYEGRFVSGVFKTGVERINWSDEEWYEGDYLDGQRTGKGEYHWENGDWYKGGFADGELMGQGELHWEDGNWHEGKFVNGERTGKGVFYRLSDEARYEGDFIDGELWDGYIYRANGDRDRVRNGKIVRD